MICIIDLLDPNDNFVTYESIINSNVKTNYVGYFGLVKQFLKPQEYMKQVRQMIQPYISMPLKVDNIIKTEC